MASSSGPGGGGGRGAASEDQERVARLLALIADGEGFIPRAKLEHILRRLGASDCACAAVFMGCEPDGSVEVDTWLPWLFQSYDERAEEGDWEAGGLSASDWAGLKEQLAREVKLSAESLGKFDPLWGEITLETVKVLRELPQHIKDQLSAVKYYPFSLMEPAPSCSSPPSHRTLSAIVDMDTFKAGHILSEFSLSPVLINFANEVDVGGGWLAGIWGAQEESLMRRSSLYLSLWPLRRGNDELWKRGVPNRGPLGDWEPASEGLLPRKYRQLGVGEGGVRVVFPHLHPSPWNSQGKPDAERGDLRTDLSQNQGAVEMLTALSMPRASPNEEECYPLTEAGAVYTPKLLVFRASDQLLSCGRVTGSHCSDRPYITSLVSVAALDLRPERGNQGVAYGGYSPLTDRGMEPTPEYLEVTRQKMRSVLHAAVQGGHDSVVLGALGCGVFGNQPEVVAAEWKALLAEGGEFCGQFKVVVYAVTFSKANFAGFASTLASAGGGGHLVAGDGSGAADVEPELKAWLAGKLQ